MANSEKIDEVIDPVVTKQVEDLQKQLVDLEKQFVDTAKAATQLNNATGQAKTYKEYTQSATQAATQTEKLQQVQNRTAITQNQLALSTLRVQQAQEKAAKSTAVNSTEYQKLVQAYNNATKAAREAGVVHGITSSQFKTAATEANALRSQLDGVDNTLGNFQRNVGNYGSAFGKVFGYIRQAAYILPGIGIAGIFNLLGEGILKLADYYGLFTQKLTTAAYNLANFNSVTKEANKDIGEQSTHLKILYTAATDLNNNYRDRIRAAQELKKEFPGELKNASDLAIINGELSGTYKVLTQDIIDNAKAKAAANKISELAAKQLDAEVQIGKIQIANENEKIHAATRTQQSQEEAFKVELRRRGLSDKLTAEQIANLKKLNDAQLKVNETARSDKRAKDAIKEQQALKKSYQDQIDFLTKFAGGNNKIAKALSGEQTGTEKKTDQKGILSEQLKAVKLTEEAILNDQKSTFDQRIEAVDKFEKDSLSIIKAGEKAKVLTHLEASNLTKSIENDAAKQILTIQENAQKALKKLLDEGAKGQNAALQDEINAFQDMQQEKLTAIDQFKSSALSGAADQYQAGIISAAEYNQTVSDIEYQSAVDRVQLQIDTQKKIIETQKEFLKFGIGSDKEMQRSKEQLVRNEIALSDLQTKKEIENIKAVERARQALADLEKEILSQSITLISTLVQVGYQTQLDALKKQSEQIDENSQSEKDAVDRSLLTSQQKADKNKVIDAQAASQKKQIAAQQAKIQEQQAKFEKAMSIARIIESTAIAEVQALTYLSNPYTAALYPAIAAAIAALGAVELATVISQPIPKYRTGTNNAKGGLSIVGDGGSELINTPSGKTYLSPETDTLVNLPKGSQVIPHEQTVRILNKDKATQSATFDMSKVVTAIDRNTKVLSNKKEKFNIQGWQREVSASQQWKAYVNNHFK